MAPICGVCSQKESKYKCPTCELRYCSIACYKQHKLSHENAESHMGKATVQLSKDRPGTTQRVPEVDFTGFEEDQDFQHLVARYPLLRIQLQSIYALTLEPGPDKARSWNREPLPGFDAPARASSNRGRGRGVRGRGRGSSRGGRDVVLPEMRQRGQWTQSKGDREALDVMKKMKEDRSSHEDAGEGMREFITLCKIKFAADDQV